MHHRFRSVSTQFLESSWQRSVEVVFWTLMVFAGDFIGALYIQRLTTSQELAFPYPFLTAFASNLVAGLLVIAFLFTLDRFGARPSLGELALVSEVNEEFAQAVEHRIETIDRRVLQGLELMDTDRWFKLEAMLLRADSLDEASNQKLEHCNRLRFASGAMHVFPIELPDRVTVLDGGYHRLILQEYVANCVENRDTWSNPQNRFARCAVCCAVHFDPQEGRLYIASVWSEKGKYGNWAFLGGDILPHMDVDLTDAAKREFVEELMPFGIQKEDIFTNDDGGEVFIFWGQEDLSPSARYEITPFVFVKVKPDFFQQTFNKPTHGRYQREASSEMPNVVVADEVYAAERDVRRLRLRRRHLESGWIYLEHWWWGWVGCNIHSEEPLQFSEPDVFGSKYPVDMSESNRSLINTIKNSASRNHFARFLGVADQFA